VVRQLLSCLLNLLNARTVLSEDSIAEIAIDSASNENETSEEAEIDDRDTNQ
jgi:hypothetical protein